MTRASFSAFRSLAVIAFAAMLAACAGLPPAQVTPDPAPSGPPAASTAATSNSSQRALVLTGGGPVGRAWQIGILKGLRDAGIDLTQADLVVGTSAGAALGTQLRGGRTLDSLYSAATAPPSGAPAAGGGPAYDPVYAREAVQPITSATELTSALRLEVAKRALAASQVISEDAQIRAAKADLGDIGDWPDQPLKLAVSDVADGSIIFIDKTRGIPIERALAAARALAGQVTPITIGDRRYMDGTVGGSNVDAAAGYGVIVVVMPPALVRADVVQQQIAAARSKGGQVIDLAPDADATAAMGSDRFDVSRVKPAAEAGARQAEAAAAELRRVWVGTAR